MLVSTGETECELNYLWFIILECDHLTSGEHALRIAPPQSYVFSLTRKQFLFGLLAKFSLIVTGLSRF